MICFWKGEVDKYTQVDIGSSFLPSELNTFPFAQLEEIEEIQKRRKYIWEKYFNELKIRREKYNVASNPKLCY